MYLVGVCFKSYLVVPHKYAIFVNITLYLPLLLLAYFPIRTNGIFTVDDREEKKKKKKTTTEEVEIPRSRYTTRNGSLPILSKYYNLFYNLFAISVKRLLFGLVGRTAKCDRMRSVKHNILCVFFSLVFSLPCHSHTNFCVYASVRSCITWNQTAIFGCVIFHVIEQSSWFTKAITINISGLFRFFPLCACVR